MANKLDKRSIMKVIKVKKVVFEAIIFNKVDKYREII